MLHLVLKWHLEIIIIMCSWKSQLDASALVLNKPGLSSWLEGTLAMRLVEYSQHRVTTSWKSPGFFCCPGKSLNFVHRSLKISGRFPVLHWDRILKLLSLVISTKNSYVKE